jgi:NHL repeat-containing protein
MSKNLARATRRVFPILVLLWLAGCGGGSGDGASGGGSTASGAPGGAGSGSGVTDYTVGGTITGLLGTVMLQNNGGDDLSLSADSSFAFATIATTGSNYGVTVRTQPAGQACTVANGAGTVSGASVTGVTVTCSSLPSRSLALFAGDMQSSGSADSGGTMATFNFPQGVATDRAGNVYVADLNNRTIRKVTPAGVVTTFAGSGAQGSTDATGTAASFNFPQGVATDSAGNVYVADPPNQTIRKITPDGAVTTLAGKTGVFDHIDGTGAEARFKFPQGVATDGADNVYVADTSNCAIRKITPAGVVTTLTAPVTDATGAPACLNVYGIAADGPGNVYVADLNGNVIRKVTPAGVVTTLAGPAGFHFPSGVTVDSAGNVYAVDNSNTVRKITPAGVITTLAGSGAVGSADAAGTAASFRFPTSVAADSAGNIYVADTGNSAIRKIAPLGEVTTLAGTAGVRGSTDAPGVAAARFNSPQGVATDTAGNVYVADSGNGTIRKITPAGVVSTFASVAGASLGTDSAGNVYVPEAGTIRKITPDGAVTTLAGSAGVRGFSDGTGPAASFTAPYGGASDSEGNVYVVDSAFCTIRKITPAGVVTTVGGVDRDHHGCSGAGGEVNGPFGVATDSADNVYATHANDQVISKMSKIGLGTLFAGTVGVIGRTDATGAAATFNRPLGVAADGAGNVYVADTGNHTIRKITPDGNVSTVVGVAGQEGFAPGPLPGLLSSPIGVAVSGTSLYITLLNGVAVVRNRP